MTYQRLCVGIRAQLYCMFCSFYFFFKLSVEQDGLVIVGFLVCICLWAVRRLLLCEELDRSSCGSVLFHGYLPPPGKDTKLQIKKQNIQQRQNRNDLRAFTVLCSSLCIFP